MVKNSASGRTNGVGMPLGKPIDSFAEHVARIVVATPPRDIQRVRIHDPVLADFLTQIEVALDLKVEARVARRHDLHRDRPSQVAHGAGCHAYWERQQPIASVCELPVEAGGRDIIFKSSDRARGPAL